MSNTENQENVVNMIKTVKGMLDELPESKLKQNAGRFLHILMSGSASFKTTMLVIDSHIKQSVQDVQADQVNTSKTIISFWTKIQKLFVETYRANR